MYVVLKKTFSFAFLLIYLAASSVATVHASTSLKNSPDHKIEVSASCHGAKDISADQSVNSLACEVFCTVMAQAISMDSDLGDLQASAHAKSEWPQSSFPSILTVIQPRPPKKI